MPRYLKDSGVRTHALDSERLIWYGVCTYWTDNWDTVGKRLPHLLGQPALPVCPHCGRPGFQITAGEWHDQIKAWDATHPGYAAMIEWGKEQCFPDHETLEGAWKEAMEQLR